MDNNKIAEKIIELRDSDLELRDKLIKSGQLGNGYNEEMKEMHDRNAEILDKLIGQIGYPTIDKVGKEASNAAWLVIQHSIGKPEFMKKALELLKVATNEQKVDPQSLAYLSDRIAVFESKPQLYGTQFDWDENGELSPQPYDDLEKVEERRKSIGLLPLEKQIEIIRKRSIEENEFPPEDLEKRRKEYNEWRKEVGWIK